MLEDVRAWARSHTERGHFSPVGIAFHWSMAVLMIFQLYWGWRMSRMPVGGDKLDAYQLHSDLGLLIFSFATFRFVWRMIIPEPINDADKPGWQSKVARWTAWTFYLCFFGLPLSGWAMWSAVGGSAPLEVAGVLPWPDMPFEQLSTAWQWAIMDWAEGMHGVLIVLLAVLIPLHIGAALRHHFWARDDVLEGMLPSIPDVAQPREALRHSETR